MGDYTDFDTQPQGKSGGGGGFLKFCLICGCILLALLAAGGGFIVYQASQLFTTDPTKVVTKVENDILPGSDVPAAYDGFMAMKIPGVMEFAVIGPQGMQQQANNQNQVALIMFVCSMPAGANQAQMKQQMQQSMQQQGGGGNAQIQVEAENQKVLKVRGQDVTFNEVIGNNNGVQTKQLIGVIPRTTGSNDQVMLMFMGKADIFDQAAVDAFLNSIK